MRHTSRDDRLTTSRRAFGDARVRGARSRAPSDALGRAHRVANDQRDVLRRVRRDRGGIGAVRAVLALIAFATTAHAQAPGQQPVPGVPAARGVMADRWAVDLAIASESLTPKVDGAPHVPFGELELSG